ncbi:MAG: HEAT repeat domain-containing protein, partial [bacterium]
FYYGQSWSGAVIGKVALLTLPGLSLAYFVFFNYRLRIFLIASLVAEIVVAAYLGLVFVGHGLKPYEVYLLPLDQIKLEPVRILNPMGWVFVGAWALILALAAFACFGRENARRYAVIHSSIAAGFFFLIGSVFCMGFSSGQISALPLLFAQMGFLATMATSGLYFMLRNRWHPPFVLALSVILLSAVPVGLVALSVKIIGRAPNISELIQAKDIEGLRLIIERPTKDAQWYEAIEQYIELDPYAALHVENKEARYTAAILLGQNGDRQAVPVLLQALRDRWHEPAGKFESLSFISPAAALGFLGDTRAVPFLKALIFSKEDPKTRIEAVIALGKLDDDRVVILLIQALGDPTVKMAAKEALITYYSKSPAIVKIVQSGLNNVEAMKKLSKVDAPEAGQLLTSASRVNNPLISKTAAQQLWFWNRSFGAKYKAR